jgi:tRNA(adenine34) deaminase
MTLQDYMQLAILQAELALSHDEVPIGALLVSPDGHILAESFNQCVCLNDPTAHAEIMVIREACKKISNYRLSDCMLVTTLEPCLMCAAAIASARITRLVFGASDDKHGACGSILDVNTDTPTNHHFEVIGGIASEKCRALLTNFFSGKR